MDKLELEALRQLQFEQATSFNEIMALQRRWDHEDAELKGATTSEFSGLFDRVAQLETLLGPNGHNLFDQIARGVGEILQQRDALQSRYVVEERQTQTLSAGLQIKSLRDNKEQRVLVGIATSPKTITCRTPLSRLGAKSFFQSHCC
jgi:phosphoglycolate phosphatase-like HAD superfamily hydrolase